MQSKLNMCIGWINTHKAIVHVCLVRLSVLRKYIEKSKLKIYIGLCFEKNYKHCWLLMQQVLELIWWFFEMQQDFYTQKLVAHIYDPAPPAIDFDRLKTVYGTRKKRKRKSLSINRKEKHKKYNVKRIQNERKYFMYSFPRHLRIDPSIPALHCTGIVCWSTWALDKQKRKKKHQRLCFHTNRTSLCNSNIKNTNTYRQAGRQAGERTGK